MCAFVMREKLEKAKKKAKVNNWLEYIYVACVIKSNMVIQIYV